MKQYLSLLLASILPLSLFSWFVPSPMNQLDFWLLWLVAMVLLALPMVYTEVALAYRSGMPPLVGLQKLTREADVGVGWRSFSWLSSIMMILVASLLITQASVVLMPVLASLSIELPDFALSVGLMVVASIASVWGVRMGLLGLLLIVGGLALSLINGVDTFSLQMTEVTLVEWGRAVMLALLSVGAGSGIYWFANVDRVVAHQSGESAQKTSSKTKFQATKVVLPIWAMQVFMGAAALLVFAIGREHSLISSVVSAIGAMCLSSLLLHFSSQLFASRFGSNTFAFIKGLLATLVLACILTIVPDNVRQVALVLLTVVSVMMLSLFSGWKMKISHLRKSMNFSSELTYNLWRVAVRLIVPIGVILAMIGWLLSWLA